MPAAMASLIVLRFRASRPHDLAPEIEKFAIARRTFGDMFIPKRVFVGKLLRGHLPKNFGTATSAPPKFSSLRRKFSFLNPPPARNSCLKSAVRSPEATPV